ncbi:MAG TPA: PHB depolymerase family esterase [Streptosporangiaceae bacterium]|nr:PHB depolymerase family esterase [Streptosporangiaceae bacterium]
MAASTTSPGAGRPGPLPVGTTRRQLSVDGSARSYLIHIPPSYNGLRPLPVVVTFHGLGATAQAQLALSGFAAVADRNGFVVVAPQARRFGWDFLTPPSRPGSDAAFVVALLRDLRSVACVDPQRCYVSGISNGAAVVFALACGNVGGFAAYGAVAGAFYSPRCYRAPPQPIVYFHGTADRLVPIDGGRVFGVPIAPARQSMAAWAAHNGCPAGARRSVVASDVTLFSWAGGRGGADVDYYVIAGGGHSWPGADRSIAQFTDRFLGRTTESISASQIMWDFFARRSR